MPAEFVHPTKFPSNDGDVTTCNANNEYTVNAGLLTVHGSDTFGYWVCTKNAIECVLDVDGAGMLTTDFVQAVPDSSTCTTASTPAQDTNFDTPRVQASGVKESARACSYYARTQLCSYFNPIF